VLLLRAWLIVLPGNAWAVTYYVAKSGSDANPGTRSGPFHTVQRAASLAQAGDMVVVNAGIYRETITPANSGTASAPITYMANSGDSVTISGADLVSGWTLSSGNIYAAADVNGFRSTNNQAVQVFVDGQMVNEARWPNTSMDVSHPTKARIASVVSNVIVNGLHQVVVADPALTQPSGYWIGATINFENAWNYALFTGTVVGYVPGALTFQYGATSGTTVNINNPAPVVGSRYFLFGKQGALDAPSEWYYDAINKQLFVWLPDSDNPTNHVVEMKRRDWGFNLNGKSYITIEGFNLFAATITTDTAAGNGNAADSFAGLVRQNSTAPSNHIILDRLRVSYPSHFTNLSGFIYNQWTNNTGIVLSGSDQILKDSVILYSAGNGVSVLGERNKVLRNTIRDVNYAGTECAGINTGFQNTRNIDHEIGYNDISISGRGLIEIRSLTNGPAGIARVHHNLLRESGLQTWDNGAIYTWQNNGNGLEIDHNQIYNNHGMKTGAGVYLDDSSYGYRIHHNVVADTDYGIIINNQVSETPAGYYNIIHHNTVIGTCRAISNYGLSNPNTTIHNNILGGGHNLGINSGVTLRDNEAWDGQTQESRGVGCRHWSDRFIK